MKVLIIEDEKPAARRLKMLLDELDSDIEVLDVVDSVEDSVSWFRNHQHPDLVFLDIQLADGLSFSIFDKISINSKIIFTTAFDHFAVKAFRVNAIDYLLKPVDQQQLEEAVSRVISLQGTQSIAPLLEQLIQKNTVNYRRRFLVKLGQQLHHVNTDQIAYFFSEDGYSFIKTLDGKRWSIDDSIDILGDQLDTKEFFRINRKFCVNIKAIAEIHKHFNSRLKLKLKPVYEQDVIVARDRVADFKAWLDQ